MSRRKIEAYGQTWSLSALASRAGLSAPTLAYRLDVKGMRPEEACEALTPRQRRARRSMGPGPRPAGPVLERLAD